MPSQLACGYPWPHRAASASLPQSRPAPAGSFPRPGELCSQHSKPGIQDALVHNVDRELDLLLPLLAQCVSASERSRISCAADGPFLILLFSSEIPDDMARCSESGRWFCRCMLTMLSKLTTLLQRALDQSGRVLASAGRLDILPLQHPRAQLHVGADRRSAAGLWPCPVPRACPPASPVVGKRGMSWQQRPGARAHYYKRRSFSKVVRHECRLVRERGLALSISRADVDPLAVPATTTWEELEDVHL